LEHVRTGETVYADSAPFLSLWAAPVRSWARRAVDSRKGARPGRRLRWIVCRGQQGVPCRFVGAAVLAFFLRKARKQALWLADAAACLSAGESVSAKPSRRRPDPPRCSELRARRTTPESR